MDFEELKERYRTTNLVVRLLLVSVIVALPMAYYYFDSVESVDNDLEFFTTQLNASRTKFERANKAFQNQGELQEQLIYTEQQLAKAREKLPDTFNVDQFLRKVATISREVGVVLDVFDPAEERCGKSEVNHKELPIKVAINGKYAEIATFVDRIVHLDISVTAENIGITRAVPDAESEAGSGLNPGADGTLSLAQAETKRKRLRLNADMELVLYKSSRGDECGGERS